MQYFNNLVAMSYVFNITTYYACHSHDVLCRGNELLCHSHDLLCHSHDLQIIGIKLLCRSHDNLKGIYMVTS